MKYIKYLFLVLIFQIQTFSYAYGTPIKNISIVESTLISKGYKIFNIYLDRTLCKAFFEEIKNQNIKNLPFYLKNEMVASTIIESSPLGSFFGLRMGDLIFKINKIKLEDFRNHPIINYRKLCKNEINISIFRKYGGK